MFARSLTLLVSLCATSVFAAPIASPDVTGLVNGAVSSTGVPIPSLPPVVGNAAGSALAAANGVVPVNGVLPRDQLSIAQVFQSLTSKATPAAHNCKAAAADKSNVNAQLLQSNLNDLITILTSTQSELQAIVNDPTGAVNSVVSVNDILTIVGPFLQLLVTVLAYVVSVVGSTPVGTVVLPLVATIGTLLGSIISLVVQLVPGLLAGLVPTLTSLVPTFGILNFNAVLALIPAPQ
ncbi:hypothetical protein BJ912DRAFT_994366 [Pholiota molesta]|nr:hypothetical protein BJ912DRAFT_994366 [Pholiota molesta]